MSGVSVGYTYQAPTMKKMVDSAELSPLLGENRGTAVIIDTKYTPKGVGWIYDDRDTFKNLLLSFMSELLFTAIFVFLGTGTIYSYFLGSDTAEIGITDQAGVLTISLGFGLSLTACLYASINISGGGLNPVLAFAFWGINNISMIRTLVYIVAQLVGGLLGSGFLYSIVPQSIIQDNSFYRYAGATVLNLNYYSIGFGVWVETVLTFFFTMIVILTVGKPISEKRTEQDPDNKYAVPLFACIGPGAALSVLMMIGYRLTGCSLNPARSLGPAVISNFYNSFGVYWGGPFAGAAIAILLYILMAMLSEYYLRLKNFLARVNSVTRGISIQQNTYAFKN